MSLEEEYSKRIAAIHGQDSPKLGKLSPEERSSYIKHVEFRAMADVFLGEDFDRDKLATIENLQGDLQKEQAWLYQSYEAGNLRPEKYLESLNKLAKDTFEKIEHILGTENFLKLFRTNRSGLAEIGGLIDKDAFFRAHPQRHKESDPPPAAVPS